MAPAGEYKVQEAPTGRAKCQGCKQAIAKVSAVQPSAGCWPCSPQAPHRRRSPTLKRSTPPARAGRAATGRAD